MPLQQVRRSILQMVYFQDAWEKWINNLAVCLRVGSFFIFVRNGVVEYTKDIKNGHNLS
jgi:hypothetical protein